MKYLKNPAVAVILSLLIVLSSSFLTAGVKLSRASDKVTDGFYQGIRYDGYKHKSIAGQLDNICGAVSGLVTIAKNYSLDTAELSSRNSELSKALSAETDRISSVYADYSSLLASLYPLLDELSEISLSDRDEKGAKDYEVTIIGAEKVIEEAGYNESVQAFAKDMSRFPADFFLSATRTKLPEAFE